MGVSGNPGRGSKLSLNSIARLWMPEIGKFGAWRKGSNTLARRHLVRYKSKKLLNVTPLKINNRELKSHNLNEIFRSRSREQDYWSFFLDLIFASVVGLPLYTEIYYNISQWSCSASGSLWEMPDSNPGPLPQKSGVLPMSHHISIAGTRLLKLNYLILTCLGRLAGRQSQETIAR